MNDRAVTRVADVVRAVPGAVLRGAPDAVLRGATHDSRRVEPGYLFAVIRGQKTDGGLYVESAIQRGASALLVDREWPCDLPQIVVADVRAALGPAAAACYGNPTAQMALVGITGTNGKTTITYLVEAALRHAGASPGVMGTVEYRFAGDRQIAEHTTPEATVVQAVARKMADGGVSHMILEASSHGLAQGRLAGCRFQVVAFTNLTQDHLDYHREMSEYGAAKLLLFTSAIADVREAVAVVNADDPFSKTILGHLKHRAITVSTDPEGSADIRPAGPPRYAIDGVSARIQTPGGICDLASPLVGAHNLSNLLVALGICQALGHAPDAASAGLGRLALVPGRLEPVATGRDFAVLVDYAHTPDALVRVLGALRPLTRGRLIAVFGCGGDRDPGKRPLMGRAVRDGADLAVVTSDNPRSEDPAAILEAIVPGIRGGDMAQMAAERLRGAARGFAVEPDRRAAIRAAVGAAAAGDTVLIAGKGHEDYQILATGKIDFDDRKEARKALDALGRGDRA